MNTWCRIIREKTPDGIAALNRSLAEDAQVKARLATVQASLHCSRGSHFYAKSKAGRPGLRNLKDRIINLVLIANVNVGLEQTIRGKVFSKLTELKWATPNVLLKKKWFIKGQVS
jgi:hypothetical protein